MIYRTSQQQTNDVFSFGMFLMLMIFTVGMVKSLVTGETEDERILLPMTKAGKQPVTVTCPICRKVIEIPDYDFFKMTRSDALRRHIEKEHKAKVKLHPQLLLIEGSDQVSPQYRDLIDLFDEPLPDYSLALLPAVEAEAGEKKIDAVMKQLKSGVESIVDSYQFRLFLTTMSKFHDYSLGNQILIMLQKPEATRVAGFNTWKNLGRWVKKNEKGIAILAPVMPARPICPSCGSKISKGTKYCPQCGEAVDEMEESPRFFRVVHVFDVSQTEGKPLPEFDIPVLTGEANEDLFAYLLAHMKHRGVPVEFDSRPQMDPGVKGFYSREGIWIRPEEPRAQQLKTLLHEIAHYYSEGVFHIPRIDAETIAESAAFVVGAHFGFDTGVRSFPYVALWARDKKVLENNLGSIRRVSTMMIDALSEIHKTVLV